MWKEGRGARRGTRCAGARGALCVGARRAEAWGAEHRFSRSRGPRDRPAPPCAPEAWSGSTEARPAPRDETGKGRARRARRGIHTPLPGRNLLSTPHRVSHPELPEAEGTVPQKEVQKKNRAFAAMACCPAHSTARRREPSLPFSLTDTSLPCCHSHSPCRLPTTLHPSVLSSLLPTLPFSLAVSSLPPLLSLPSCHPHFLPPSLLPSLPPSLPRDQRLALSATLDSLQD